MTLDLLGDNTERAQALANEIARRDFKRNNGQESIETGKCTDLFSMSRFQIDLVDVCDKASREDPECVLVEVSPTRKPKQSTTGAGNSSKNIKLAEKFKTNGRAKERI